MGLAVKGYLIDADNTVNWEATSFEVTEGERVFMSVQLARGATQATAIPFVILPASTAGSADFTITAPRSHRMAAPRPCSSTLRTTSWTKRTRCSC